MGALEPSGGGGAQSVLGLRLSVKATMTGSGSGYLSQIGPLFVHKDILGIFKKKA
jgi:hypothetical protein